MVRDARRPRRGPNGPLVPDGDAPISSLIRRPSSVRRFVTSKLGQRRHPQWFELDPRPFEASEVVDPGPSGEPFAYQPPTWHRARWPGMRSFALPTFSDAHVRVNLAGRERDGVVGPQDYRAELDRVETLLRGCRDPRDGRTVVGQCERPNLGDPLRPDGPPADLIVVFDRVVDAVAHPDLGLIGPFPYLRSGEHGPRGFVVVSGAHMPSWPDTPVGVHELGPGILDLLAADRPTAAPDLATPGGVA